MTERLFMYVYMIYQGRLRLLNSKDLKIRYLDPHAGCMDGGW